MLDLFDIKIDYDFYETEYHGKMAEDDFTSALPDARAEVSYAIWPGADLEPHQNKVRMALCAVADIIGNPERRLKSYSSGKTSETYGSAGYAITSEAAIRRWLGNLNILKRGKWL